MASIEVRPARAGDDLAAAGRIVQQAYFAVPGYPHDDQFDRELADLTTRPREATIVVGFLDGTLRGCLTFVSDTSSGVYEFPVLDATTFRYFGVDPAARGSGLAEAMVQWCADETRRLGVARVRIHTLTVMLAAQRLYERLGFVRDPRYDEIWDDAIGLSYRLDV